MCQIKEGTFKAKGTLKAKDSFKAKGIYNITPLNIQGTQCETLKPNAVREPKQKMNRKTNEHSLKLMVAHCMGTDIKQERNGKIRRNYTLENTTCELPPENT